MGTQFYLDIYPQVYIISTNNHNHSTRQGSNRIQYFEFRVLFIYLFIIFKKKLVCNLEVLLEFYFFRFCKT
jgi:hypothetical protein